MPDMLCLPPFLLSFMILLFFYAVFFSTSSPNSICPLRMGSFPTFFTKFSMSALVSNDLTSHLSGESIFWAGSLVTGSYSLLQHLFSLFNSSLGFRSVHRGKRHNIESQASRGRKQRMCLYPFTTPSYVYSVACFSASCFHVSFTF